MRNKIIVASIILLIASLIFFIIYYNKDSYNNVDIEISDIMNKIFEDLESDIPPMIVLNEHEIIDLYDIDTTLLESYIFKTPMMNIRADEIIIMKVKQRKDISYIKRKLNDRLKVIQGSFEKYLTDQYELTKNPILIVKGKYVLMSISDKNDVIENIFNSYFVKNTNI